MEWDGVGIEESDEDQEAAGDTGRKKNSRRRIPAATTINNKERATKDEATLSLSFFLWVDEWRFSWERIKRRKRNPRDAFLKKKGENE